MASDHETEKPANLEATLDASRSDAGAPQHVAGVALVEGTGPELTGLTNELLRDRLRAAGLIIFASFLVFWTAGALGLLGPVPRHLHVIQFVVTSGVGAVSLPLCRRCDRHSAWSLWLAEALIFGLPVLFFVVYQITDTVNCALTMAVLPTGYSPWCILIFTYALFIPNTWPRAAIVTGLIATTPTVVSVVLLTTNAACQAASNANAMFVIRGALIMLVAATSATFGVHTIRRLRNEVFQARKFGQYHLRRKVGAGGMGEVYLAEHQLMKRPCAIKIISPDRAGDPRALARFEREVQTIAKLSHWNSVDIYDYGRTADGTFYYVMEYLPGMSLRQMVDEFGPLPAARTIHLLRQTCGALQEAHELGLVHRDIKPANIIAARRGGIDDVAKLLDFGLAKPISENKDLDLSGDGSIIGSPLYMSPEHAAGEHKVDRYSDIYSLGAVSYFLLTGRPPFQGKTAIQVLIAHSNQLPARPSELVGGIPNDLEVVVLRCLEKDPRDRFQSATELANALASCRFSGDWSTADAKHWWDSHAAPDQQTQHATTLEVS